MKLTGKIANDGFKAVSEEHFTSGHHKVPRIWILLADKHTARIFRKNDGHLELIGEAAPSKTGHKEALPNESIGRTGSGGGGAARHKLEPHMEPGRKEALSFTHDIAVWLGEAVAEDAFDRLVLVAAPKMLGDLRKGLGDPVQSRIVAEVDKDLTKMKEPELRKELEKIVWF